MLQVSRASPLLKLNWLLEVQRKTQNNNNNKTPKTKHSKQIPSCGLINTDPQFLL